MPLSLLYIVGIIFEKIAGDSTHILMLMILKCFRGIQFFQFLAENRTY